MKFSPMLVAVSAVALVAGSAARSSETQTLTYDELGRLVSVSSSGTINNGQKHSICYDPAGNRTQYKSDSAGAGLACTGAAPPSLALADASVTEGGLLTFTVSRSGDTAGAVSASFASASGSATSGSDFTAVSGTVSFAAGQTSATVSVSTIDDTVVEAVETMSVTLSAPTGGAVISRATGTGTINDNDAAPANLAIGDASITEGGTLAFPVTRSGNTATAVSASYSTVGGTATAGSDFTSATGTVSFAANQTSATINVATIDDALVESAETMSVSLSSPSSGATIVTASGTGTINDNDTAPANLAIGNASTTEGGTLAFTVTRSGNTASAVSAAFNTAGGTATSGSDFTAASGTVSFAANQTSATINVATIDDTLVEPAETMTVSLSAPSSGATIVTANGTGTINDNDTAGTPSISISDASGVEAQNLVFTVTLSSASSSTVTVNYATAVGTAGAGDFTAASGTLTFAPGETSKTIAIATNSDIKVEVDEIFYVNLTSPTNATIGDGQGIGTIFDDGLGGGGGGCTTC